MNDTEAVPCETCGQSTTNTGTKRCYECWKVESRLKLYLERGGDKARVFVLKTVTVVDGLQGEP